MFYRLEESIGYEEFIRNSSFVLSVTEKQLSFYFLHLISKNYLQRLDAIKTHKKYIVYQNVELD